MENKQIKNFDKIVKILTIYNFKKIQFYPASFSYLAVAKEIENVSNIFFKKKHLLFYYSLFPKLYSILFSSKLRKLFNIFYLNRYFKYEDLNIFFKESDIKKFIKSKIIIKEKKKFKCDFSFVPYKNLIFVRDKNLSYHGWFEPKKNLDKVWMGADTIIFLKFLEDFLKRKNFFKNALEIGSGTGAIMLSLSNNFKSCSGVDINKKAINFSFLNSKINKIKNYKIFKSNIFQNVKGRYDLVISNPWFVDLKKGGLELLPKIVQGLDKYLNKNGTCLLIMNSYYKNKRDTLEDYFSKLLIKKNYDVNLYTNGIFYEFERSNDYKKYKVDYAISYCVEIKIKGSGILKKFDANFLRKTRDRIFLIFLKIRNKFY